MPGTYRYSATFDRTYEEETPPSSDSRSRPKTRQPSYGRSLSDYGCHRRSTSTDSLDSMCGSSSSSTSHSRQVSGDSTEYIPTRRLSKASAKPAHNPLQFVKISQIPLYRQQQEQKKTETKVVKEKVKEEEEEWQSNLDSWKSRRRKQSEGSLQRLEEIRRIELEEQQRQLEQKKVRTKTFSEMMEERAHRPKQYNLLILGRPTSEDEMKSDEDISSMKSDTNEDNEKTNNEEVISNNTMKNSIPNGSHTTENEINNNTERDKSEVERSNANGGYTNIDSGLDSLSSSHKAGDIADSASDFSQDSGSSLDSDFQHTTGSLTTGVELLEEFSSNPLSHYEKKSDDGVELFLRIWLKQGSESKDFGFVVKEGKDQSTPVVSMVYSGGVGDLAGLRKGDQVLAINGEYTQGHDNEVIQFALQQAIYVGHLDLLIWRSNSKDTKDSDSNGIERERSNSLISQRKSAFENGIHDKKGIQKSTKDIRSAVDFKEKVSSFERRSSMEHSSSLTKSLSSRKPPPIPNKPRLRSKSVPDANFFHESNGDSKAFDDSDDKEVNNSDSNFECTNDSQCSNDLDQSSVSNQENLDSGSESKNTSAEIIEKNIEKISKNKDDDDDDDDDTYPTTTNCDDKEESQPHRLVNLNPIYQDSGLNIIYDSHPMQETENATEKHELSLKIEQPVATLLESKEDSKSEGETKEDSKNGEEGKHLDKNLENSNDSTKTLTENVSQSIEEKNNVQEVKNEEDVLKLQYDNLLNADIYQIPLNLNQDDILLADLDVSPRQLEPPKEKPPPPPLDVSDVESSENVPTTRHNSTKEIKRELWKRRSDFLGIEFEDGAIEVDENQIPPPSAMEDFLKSERELEREKRQLLEEQTSIRLRRLAEEEEIARKEREIIESIEREERERQQQELEAGNCNLNEESTLYEKSETNQQCKEQDRLQEQQILQEREEYVKQQEGMETLKKTNQHNTSGSKQSNVNSVDTLSSLSSNSSAKIKSEEAKTDSVLPNRTPSKKMLLRQERERLRREQEALQKQREEYERQVKLQQQKWLQQQQQQTTSKQKQNNVSLLSQNKVPNKTSSSHETATSNQVKDELWEREDIIYASRQPQAAPPTQSDDMKLKNEGNELSNGKMALQPQALSKRSLHNLGAAPKAKIVNNEKWIKPAEKVLKRRTETTLESGYNQYHWLVQEAEMRRITEQKERQCQFASEHRSVHSRNSGITLNHQSQTNMLHHNQKQPLNHITPSAHPCGYSVDHQWNRSNNTTNGRHSGQLKDGKQCFGYTKPHRDISPTKPPRSRNSNTQEHLLSVSGRKRCSHCGEELGHGAAMIIESLQLFYHIQCFCCCVCQTQLGNGSCGTDVRVRNNKLHCQHCYSNDEAGLKFSQV
ncbi:putative leucine-rich repeat-containing protein DDB_G0290503 isoform X2 [Centruroides vittatus]|uniref:putative leucine-rich repeat-containing protein DDB_G0290503 isoform X2 n=1 Tax=Centruroides vittatus TaxID=120091 RepID=UPI00350F73D4